MTKISRSKIELFLNCPRCFWLYARKGIKRPPPAPYTINSAVDYLLKQEFDIHREKGTPHPIMEKFGIDAVPFKTPEINKWRHNFSGVEYNHKPSGFLIHGAVDDVWVNPNGELIVVDYKATGANQHKIYDSYKRQMEIYQWLLQKNDYPVSNLSYFVFARVNKAGGFGMGKGSLLFDIFAEPCRVDNSWVDNIIPKVREIFDLETPPASSPDCEHCKFSVLSGLRE